MLLRLYVTNDILGRYYTGSHTEPPVPSTDTQTHYTHDTNSSQLYHTRRPTLTATQPHPHPSTVVVQTTSSLSYLFPTFGPDRIEYDPPPGVTPGFGTFLTLPSVTSVYLNPTYSPGTAPLGSTVQNLRFHLCTVPRHVTN